MILEYVRYTFSRCQCDHHHRQNFRKIGAKCEILILYLYKRPLDSYACPDQRKSINIFSPKGSFSSSSLNPYYNCILTRGTSYSLIKVSSFQMKYLLSNLNDGSRSYLRTTKRCQTRYFMLAPIY